MGNFDRGLEATGHGTRQIPFDDLDEAFDASLDETRINTDDVEVIDPEFYDYTEGDGSTTENSQTSGVSLFDRVPAMEQDTGNSKLSRMFGKRVTQQAENFPEAIEEKNPLTVETPIEEAAAPLILEEYEFAEDKLPENEADIYFEEDIEDEYSNREIARPVPSPLSNIINRTRETVSLRRQERLERQQQLWAQQERDRQHAEAAKKQTIENYKDTEAERLGLIEQQARLHRMFPSIIERPKDLGLKHHGDLAELTRAYVAKHLELPTGVKWDNHSESLHAIEAAQSQAVITRAVEQARGVYKVDTETELNAERRKAIIDEAATANQAQINRALRAELPEIYVFDSADYDQDGNLLLNQVAVTHREHAFETTALSREVDLEQHEWEIGFHNREIRVTSRLKLDGDRYDFDPDHNGIGKLLGALGTTIENQHPDALGFRTSGLIKFDKTQDDKSPEETRLGGAAIYEGGAVISARFAGVEVEETIPEFTKPTGLLQLLTKSDRLASSLLDLPTSVSSDMEEEPTFIAAMTVEARHVTADTYSWLLGLHKERTANNSNEDVPYQDQTAYAMFFAEAIHKMAIPGLKHRAGQIRHANFLAAKARNNYLEKVSLGELKKPLPTQGELPPPSPDMRGLPMAPPTT